MFNDLQKRKNRLTNKPTMTEKIAKYLKTSNNFKLII